MVENGLGSQPEKRSLQADGALSLAQQARGPWFALRILVSRLVDFGPWAGDWRQIGAISQTNPQPAEIDWPPISQDVLRLVATFVATIAMLRVAR